MKQLAVNIFNFYIFSNIHVALSVGSLYLIFNQNIDNKYLFFLIFSTIAGYNFIRFFNFGENRFFIKKFIAKNPYSIAILFLISIGFSIYYYLILDFKIQVSLIPFIIISFFYNYNYKFAPSIKLRNNGVVKIISVALVWGGMTTLIPHLQSDESFRQTFFQFIWVFLYVLMLTLSFDQRDIFIDHQELKTIPQLCTEKLQYVYIGLSVTLLVIASIIFSGHNLLIVSVFIIISAILGYKSNENKSYYYTAFWIESLPIFLLLSLKIF